MNHDRNNQMNAAVLFVVARPMNAKLRKRIIFTINALSSMPVLSIRINQVRWLESSRGS